MKIKPAKGWAIVNKNKPIINIDDIYSSKNDIGEIFLDNDEKFIRVEIKEVKK